MTRHDRAAESTGRNDRGDRAQGGTFEGGAAPSPPACKLAGFPGLHATPLRAP